MPQDPPDLADEVNAGEEHLNPATGYIETTPHLDDAGAGRTPVPVVEDPEEEHYNPSTGYIETTPRRDPV